MPRKYFILLICLASSILLFAYTCKNKFFVDKSVPIAGIPSTSVINKRFEAKSISVIGSNDFDIKLVDGTRVRGRLGINAAPEARNYLVKLINNSVMLPEVVFKKRVGDIDGYWLVEIYVIIDPIEKKEISLSEWLITNGLAWS